MDVQNRQPKGINHALCTRDGFCFQDGVNVTLNFLTVSFCRLSPLHFRFNSDVSFVDYRQVAFSSVSFREGAVLIWLIGLTLACAAGLYGWGAKDDNLLRTLRTPRLAQLRPDHWPR